ncbi:MAG TPA: hypothetical protein DCS66_19320 [Flavobacteriaceae bacterium]|nr:hypothetical protein [Flavobacteriaceae bacterium]HAT66709.1 hypothetical protein [Flavobacteriaceae bacterium]|tara:strand:- start:27 stop:737 length:711 start_codon:yes stop_codon:yes gene_type:complete
MNELFNQFHNNVLQRINRYQKLYYFGEDSIRYDFYQSALNYYNLDTTDLILEQNIPNTQFVGNPNDRPEYDLRIDSNEYLDFGILCEFAFFRLTENNQNLPRPKLHGKLLNDIFRLSLLKHYNNAGNNPIYNNFNNYKCFMICVTDNEMINYGQGNNVVQIQEEYILNNDFLNQLSDTCRDQIQPRFQNKVNELNLIPTAKRVFEQIVPQNANTPLWCTWIWEVDYRYIKKGSKYR